ncbi:MAG: hypothetical protein OEY11_12740 [Gammaproteobacteria bacterium]|nr:hypothetical protein [Gammaproteobacteria bacterium]
MITSHDIWQRNLIFFPIYALSFSSLNLIPQFFFLEYYPEQKTSYLAVLLIFASFVSILGIFVAEKVKDASFNLRYFSLFIFLICSVLTSGLFLLSHWLPYVIAFILLKFLTNIILHFLDINFVKNTAKGHIFTHSNSSSLFQLLAIVAASLYLGFYHQSSLLNSTVFVTTLFVCLFIAWGKIPYNLNSKENTPVRSTSCTRITSYQKSFLLYAAIVFSAYGIFSALLMYFISDYYTINNPEKSVGIILALTCIAGSASILLFSKFYANNNVINYAPRTVIIMSIINCIDLLLFIYKPFDNFLFIATLSMITGISYGLFMTLSRLLISQFIKQDPHSAVLSIYNNLPNYSFLFGFITILLLQFLAPHLEINSHLLSLIVITSLFPVSLIFFRHSYIKHYQWLNSSKT